MENNKKHQKEDLSGQDFGKLKVLEYYGPKWPEKRNKGHQWRCSCFCGEVVIVLGASLKSGNTKSCGCGKGNHRFIDLTGKRYGHITVQGVAGRRNKQVLWHCRCDCGADTYIVGASLRRGATKSCGSSGCCGRGTGRGNWKHGLSGQAGYKAYLLGQDPSRKLRHYVGSVVQRALKKCLGGKFGKSTFDALPYTAEDLRLHLESLWESWMNWDNYGGRPDEERQTWWIDHIIPHSSFPYQSLDDHLFQECWALSNLRPMEKHANIKKSIF